MAETIASYEVPEHHVKMYTANVEMALNKEGGILEAHVDTKMDYVGEKVQIVNFIGKVEFTERTSPYGDTQVSQLEHQQTWIVGREFDCAVFVDRLDQLKMIYDPTSPYVEAMRDAAARKRDEIIMSKFFATMKTGKDAVTDTAYSATRTVANGGTRFSVAKLRSVRKLMKKAHIKLRTVRPRIAVTADEVDDLLDEVAVGSHDFNAVKPLVDGEVSQFMGFDFVPFEDEAEDLADATSGKSIPITDAGIRTCPAWVPEGMHYGQWQGLTITASNRADKNNIKQLHATFTGNATRRDQKKVFGVEVDTTV